MADAVVAPHLRVRQRPSTPHRKRLDIQGMRALAVGVVLVYHVWPDLLPGGFVGVDVFFVLSGFLIIGSLARELERNGRIRLLDFYQRRIRRLLPAASVVLLVTVGLSLWVLVPSRLLRNLGDAVASSLQVANWRFAFGPDAYAEATAGVSPFQHFWSLAIEEQFYIVIPVLLMVIGAVALGRHRSMNQTVVVVLSVVTALSLAWSVIQTAASPSIAYFSTATRAWELLAGGLGALLLPRAFGFRASTILGFLGLFLVLGAAVFFSTELPFPGALALIPVVGTVLLLAAGGAAKGGPVTSVLGRRPLTWVGDISYSLYLWHWPIVVVALSLFGPTLGRLDGPVVIALSLIVAALSERFVERPFRRAVGPARRAHRTQNQFGVLIGGSLVVAVTVLAALVPLFRGSSTAEAVATDYPGAAALAGAPVPIGLPPLPAPADAFGDGPIALKDGCMEHDPTLSKPGELGPECVYGPAASDQTVVLVGDSHAAVLSSPLAELANEQKFRLITLVQNGCPFTFTAPTPQVGSLGDCEERNRRSVELILRERPDAVVVASMTPSGYEAALSWQWESFDAAVAGYKATIDPLAEAGIAVVVVRDTPYFPYIVPDCVASKGAALCQIERDALTGQPDALFEAARTVPNVSLLDLTDQICGDSRCESVVGNVIVYRDNHLTDTYALTLASELGKALSVALNRT